MQGLTALTAAVSVGCGGARSGRGSTVVVVGSAIWLGREREEKGEREGEATGMEKNK